MDGTRLCVQLSWKCTASPESRTNPVFGSCTRRHWCSGVWPGVETIVTLPSPKTSWSPPKLLDRLRGSERRLAGSGHRPVVLGALDQHGGRREQRDVADVIAVGM